MRRFFKAPNYYRAFGLFAGIKFLFSIECKLSQKSSQVYTYRITDYKRLIYLRRTISDHSIFWQCLVTRQYDLKKFPQITKFMRNYQECLSRGLRPVIIDAGANIGLSTVWFERLFPNAHIISIEPDRNNFEILKKNTNDLSDNISIIHGALTERSGNYSIVNPEAGSSAFRVARQDEEDDNSVRGYTIEGLMTEVAGGELFIVKLDIEGSQKHLFSSNVDWVSDAHLIILELDDWMMPWQATAETFFKAVSVLRFDYLIHGENIFCFQHIADD
jgi:FkbM family methyltransferase